MSEIVARLGRKPENAMTAVSMEAGGNFRVGDVFSRAWTILAANFGFFIGVTVVSYGVPALIAGGLFGLLYAAGRLGPSTPAPVVMVAVSAAVVLFLIGYVVVEAALVFGAFQYLRGRPVRLGDALRTALGRLMALVGMGFLWGIAVFVGLLVFVVPGIIMIVVWAVMVPACVVEGLGPAASLSRSADLTSGHRWKSFGILALVMVLNSVGDNVVALLLTPAGDIVASLGSLVATAVVTGYGHCVLVMTYHDLRVAKEGIDTEQIAAVFD